MRPWPYLKQATDRSNMMNSNDNYDGLPEYMKDVFDDVDADLARAGIDTDADLAATENAETPVETPASVTVTRDKSAPESFGSRSKARAYVRDNPGYKVVDNGTAAENRWTVAASGTPTKTSKPKTEKAPTATTAAKPTAKPRAAGKKEAALSLYAEMKAAGTLKRSTFLAEMESRTGLSAKGASSYFYRIKGGKW